MLNLNKWNRTLKIKHFDGLLLLVILYLWDGKSYHKTANIEVSAHDPFLEWPSSKTLKIERSERNFYKEFKWKQLHTNKILGEMLWYTEIMCVMYMRFHHFLIVTYYCLLPGHDKNKLFFDNVMMSPL